MLKSANGAYAIWDTGLLMKPWNSCFFPTPLLGILIMKNQVIVFFSLKTGLIIDAFGELRDQQEQVREDMEV